MKTPRHRKRANRGITMIISTLILVLFMVIGLALIRSSLVEGEASAESRIKNQAFYYAEAGLESMYTDLREYLVTNAGVTEGVLNAKLVEIVNDHSDANADVDPVRGLPETYEYSGSSEIDMVNFALTPTVLDSGPYKGLRAGVRDFNITVEVEGPAGSRAQLTRTVQYASLPLAQFAILFGKGVDMEFSPGSKMSIEGRVHANGDMYLRAPGDTADISLTFQSFITAAGNIYRFKKGKRAEFGDPGMEMSWARSFDPFIQVAGAHVLLDKDHLRFDADGTGDGDGVGANDSAWVDWSDDSAPPGGWATQAMADYRGFVRDSDMGVEEIVLSIPGYDINNASVSSHNLIEVGNVMYNKALIVIENGIISRRVAGDLTDITGTSAGQCDPAPIDLTREFHDGREGGILDHGPDGAYHKVAHKVKLVQVDLNSFLQDVDCRPANGLMYIHRTILVGGPDELNAVRLINGKDLRGVSLTIVTEQPLYVVGNYNTVNKVPAALIADAITILSQKWIDTNLDGDFFTDDFDPNPGNQDTYDDDGHKRAWDRDATDTTINAALMMGPSHETEWDGSTLTRGGWPVRFLENWWGEENSDPIVCYSANDPSLCYETSDFQVTIKGSIIVLWHSEKATVPFRWYGSGKGYYSQPLRDYDHDTLFDSSPPPEMPSFIVIRRMGWSQGS